MLRTFEGFKEYKPAVYDYIFGLPSGEVIDVTEDEIVNLKKERVIKFDNVYKCFVFLDQNYKTIRKLLLSPTKIDYIYYFLDSIGVKRGDIEINEDMSVNIYGDVNMYGIDLEKGGSKNKFAKIPIKFITVDGDFICGFNDLETLENAPYAVTGLFDCSHNKLKSLVGGPKHVAGGYECCFNELQNLEGFPETCKVKFDCAHNKITSLKGAPEKLQVMNFNVSHNKLKSLINGPKSVYSFDCSHNEITTLANGVREAKGIFDCSHNKLYNLMGMPTSYKLIFREGNEIDEVEYD